MKTVQEYVREDSKNLPLNKFRAGAITATIWKNTGTRANGEESEFNTISIERGYQDKEGNWQKTNSMRVSDLPKLQVVIAKAYESLVLAQQEFYAKA
tara:strand:- start:9848 stop:10138 length:291 start_codon:yes stop_codon:yes gene_type:complete